MATDINYPSAQLPAPSASYAVQKTDGSITTKFASGKTRRRNIHNDLRRVVNLQWEFSQEQLDFFTGWFLVVVNNGSLNFNIDLLLDGTGLNSYEVTPLSGFKGSHFGVGYFKVTLQVLCLDAKYVSDPEIFELFDYYGDSIESMLAAGDSLDNFINQVLPDSFKLIQDQ